MRPAAAPPPRRHRPIARASTAVEYCCSASNDEVVTFSSGREDCRIPVADSPKFSRTRRARSSRRANSWSGFVYSALSANSNEPRARLQHLDRNLRRLATAGDGAGDECRNPFAAADIETDRFVDGRSGRPLHPAQRVGDALARHQVDELRLLQGDGQRLLDGAGQQRDRRYRSARSPTSTKSRALNPGARPLPATARSPSRRSATTLAAAVSTTSRRDQRRGRATCGAAAQRWKSASSSCAVWCRSERGLLERLEERVLEQRIDRRVQARSADPAARAGSTRRARRRAAR